MRLAPALPWTATIDNTAAGLSGIPTRLMMRGDFYDVPVMLGTNSNEGVMFVLIVPSVISYDLPLDASSALIAAKHFWGDEYAANILSLYDHYLTYENVLAAAITDWFFACTNRRS